MIAEVNPMFAQVIPTGIYRFDGVIDDSAVSNLLAAIAAGDVEDYLNTGFLRRGRP
jgi:hypothetical protein